MKYLSFTVSSLIILSSCCILSTEKIKNQPCNFSKSVCTDNLNALQSGIAQFNAKGGMYIIKNMDSGEIIENTSVNFNEDTVYETYFSKINFENKTTPEKLLNKYVNLIQSSSKGLHQKLRENVLKGTARKANIKNAEVYGITATSEKGSDKIVITTFLGHLKHNGKNYAYVFVMDEPKGLKQTCGWQSAGWNVVPTAKEVIENIVK